MGCVASTKNTADQRSVAREKVRAMQEAQRRSERRQRSLIITSAVVVAVLLVGLVVFAVTRAQANQPDLAKVVAPTGVTDTGGISAAGPAGAADQPVKVVEYLDYQCPACQQFDLTVGPYLKEQVAAGAVEMEYHPLNFLGERGSSTQYSARSANAAYCLADDGKGDIEKFSDTLYAEQPAEGGAGLPDQDLVSAAKDAGASGAVEQCITSQTHTGYVEQQTKAATAPQDGKPATVQATPTVIIDGKTLQDTSLAGVTAAIQAAKK